MSWKRPPSSNQPQPWDSLREPGFKAIKVRGSRAGFAQTGHNEWEILKGPTPLSIPMTSILQSGLCITLRGGKNFPAVITVSLSPGLYFPSFTISLFFFLPTRGVSNKFIKISQCST